MKRERILIIGYSTRDMAHSATRAGLQVKTIDYFGDYDQRTGVSNISLLRDYSSSHSAALLTRLALKEAPAPLVYGADLENYPDLVRALEKKHEVLGNTGAGLEKARNLSFLRKVLEKAGFSLPPLRWEERIEQVPGRWLIKPRSSGGGAGISWYKRGQKLGSSFYLQQYLPGPSFSAQFLADGEKSLLLGVTRHITGSSEFAARGFKYVGNIFPVRVSGETAAAINLLVKIITEACGLKGLNGVDFVLQGGKPVLLEVNPRFTGATELLEISLGRSFFPLHLEWGRGKSSQDIKGLVFSKRIQAKAVLYARETLIIKDNRIFSRFGARDIPWPGDLIKKGQPMCTLFSRGESQADCWQKLKKKSRALQGALYRGRWQFCE